MAETIRVKLKTEYEGLSTNKIYDGFIRPDGMLIFAPPEWLLVDLKDCEILEESKFFMYRKNTKENK